MNEETGVGWRRVRRNGEVKGVHLRFFLSTLFHDERLPPELGYEAMEVELVTDEEWTAGPDTRASHHQGLTLLHLSSHPEHSSWDELGGVTVTKLRHRTGISG